MDVLGLDVGGANLKAAHTAGVAASAAFALWRHPGRLADELRRLTASMPPHERVAVTMTGELCDCFESKAQGVAHILDAAADVFGEKVDVWTTAGRFVDPRTARGRWLETASANWLALATFAGRFAPPGYALLIDVGTTTTDIVPLFDRKPIPAARTDVGRLESGELLYRGWRRTPLCAVYPEGAAELFATTHDISLVLRWVPEDPQDRDTADGQPATRAAALRRLARMRLADRTEIEEHDLVEFARMLARRIDGEILQSLGKVVRRLPEREQMMIVSGSGCFLAHDAIATVCPVGHSLDAQLGPAASAAACAHAVAVLRAEAG